MNNDHLTLAAMLAALTEGQAYESRWIDNTLVVAVVEREQPRILAFTRDGLLNWFDRARPDPRFQANEACCASAAWNNGSAASSTVPISRTAALLGIRGLGRQHGC